MMKTAFICSLFFASDLGLGLLNAADEPPPPPVLAAPDSVAQTPPAAELRTKANEVLGTLPARMPGAEKDTPTQVALGRQLYFDKLLSVNQTISCSSCHGLEGKQAGVDGQPTSKGALGQRGERNSPTVLNAGFHFAQFWDGRAPDLREQAKGPILNPVEMAMPNEGEVVQRLKESAEYPARFAAAFPDEASPVTYDNLARAVAAFERTLITHDRFDDFLKGDDAALNPQELAGLNLFLTTGCTTCHQGPLLGGTTYQKLGLVHPYEKTTDKGRFQVTKDEDDTYKFKVPSLRNSALTAPYFHDGSLATLKEVVPKMAYLQLDKRLAPAEVDAIVAFLNTLSDKARR